jgi:hypothetical protein
MPFRPHTVCRCSGPYLTFSELAIAMQQSPARPLRYHLVV